MPNRGNDKMHHLTSSQPISVKYHPCIFSDRSGMVKIKVEVESLIKLSLCSLSIYNQS